MGVPPADNGRAPLQTDQALLWAARRLEAAGVESPRFEAQLLLAMALGVTRSAVLAGLHPRLTPPQAQELERLVRERERRVPLAYLRGTQEFYGLTFLVSPAVLIPRPETELLVEFALEKLASCSRKVGASSRSGPHPLPPSPTLRERGNGEAGSLPSLVGSQGGGANRCSPDPGSGGRGLGQTRRKEAGGLGPTLADVGTGSGCIAIATLAHCLPARAVAFDISADALALARQNAALHNVADRLRFARANLLTGAASERFDFVVSNPPYIPTAEVAALQPEVRAYEPHIALDGGPDGMQFQRGLAQGALRALKPGGWLAVEVALGQAEAVASLLRSAGFLEVSARRDLAGIERLVCGQKPPSGE
ncbi:MAG TPA: HemK/PrmC family methyltransferase [Chthonomonadaceae bacterium]|nr:HemK/PrmC family methyltransferase [Chthonomonadaceae bacterium]